VPRVDGVAIRRCHIFVQLPLSRPLEIRCPDCGIRITEVVERLDGCQRHECRRCKDANGERVRWLFLFYTDAEEYVNAVRYESETITLDKES
jgi:hypothetical protein